MMNKKEKGAKMIKGLNIIMENHTNEEKKINRDLNKLEKKI